MKEPVPASIAEALQRYPESGWAALFFAVYGLAIAVLKDVPDIKGDQHFNIQSYSVQLGPTFMFG